MNGSRMRFPLLAHPVARRWSLRFATSHTVREGRERDQLSCQPDCVPAFLFVTDVLCSSDLRLCHKQHIAMEGK